jgi:dihydroflavonol-4-reductase
MKIFITGATGFIGTHLLRRLSQTSHKLYCLARQSSNTQHIKEAGATIVIGDVTDKRSLLEGMKGCDWVINLANIYTFWEPNRRIYTDVNVEGTRNVMESALENGISKVLHVSTALIYGKPADVPFTEQSKVGPARFSEYARTKYEGDLIAWEIFNRKRLPLVVVYPGMVVGPGNPKYGAQLVRNLVERRMPVLAFANKTSFMAYVGDVADVIVRALVKEGNLGEKYLVGQQISMREFYQMISEISRVPLPKLSLPNNLAMVNAQFMTFTANLTKKQPMWGLAVDSMRTANNDLMGDGSKVERELGISYTSIRVALEEEIAFYRR